MKTLKEKQLEFLNETIAYYNSTNRGWAANGGCSYAAGCAIGRKIEDKELCKRFDSYTNKLVTSRSIFNQLPNSLKELGKEFLSRVQDLHDDNDNWELEGLSEEGEEEVQAIIEEFDLNDLQND